MKILIVDDEAPARERLRRQLVEIAPSNRVTEAMSGEDAVRLCSQQEPDVVLMDIRMPGMGGLEAAVKISSMPSAPAVIFTTAYGEHALEAYSASPADYLVKPIRQEKLANALEKAKRPTRPQIRELEVRPEPAKEQRTTISARCGERLQVIALDTVVAFCADNKYTNVIHHAGEVLIDESLKSLEAEFPERFVRIHRETLISLRHLDALERTREGHYQVRMVDEGGEGRCFRVSRRHAASVKQRLRAL
ncbi:MAG: LytTR family DNA-binding domain-containing protein [Pseudomonadota bacterium]